MEVEYDVFNSQGKLLLSMGHILSERDLPILLNQGITELYAHLVKEGPIEGPIDKAHKGSGESESIKRTNQFSQRIHKAQQSYSTSLESVKQLFDQVRVTKRIQVNEYNSLFEPLHSLSMQQKSLFHSLTSLHDKANYLYQHSIQVGLISAVMAKLIGYSEEDCFEIGKAGLFHDIGKLLLPTHLVERDINSSLTPEEREQCRKHPEYGHTLLQNSEGTTQWMLDGALYHHEELLGNGYPSGIKSDRIPQVAQIIAAADMYDNLSSSPIHLSTPSPFFAAVEIMKAAYDNKLNIQIVTPFVSFISPSFVGEAILLSTGVRAEIIKMQADEPHRPIIRLETGEFIDLKLDRKTSIERVLL